MTMRHIFLGQIFNSNRSPISILCLGVVCWLLTLWLVVVVSGRGEQKISDPACIDCMNLCFTSKSKEIISKFFFSLWNKSASQKKSDTHTRLTCATKSQTCLTCLTCSTKRQTCLTFCLTSETHKVGQKMSHTFVPQKSPKWPNSPKLPKSPKCPDKKWDTHRVTHKVRQKVTQFLCLTQSQTCLSFCQTCLTFESSWWLLPKIRWKKS